MIRIADALLFPSLFFWAFTLAPASTELKTEKKCDKRLFLDPDNGETVNISSPGYPEKSYIPGSSYKWCLYAPDDTIVSILCEEFDIPESAGCEENALTLSFGQDIKYRSYCGSKPFKAKSSSNQMTVSFHSSKDSCGGKFCCRVQPQREVAVSTRAVVYERCDCGYSYRMRIVGGQEAGVNEFPFMAGLVDARRRTATIVCGASIISQRYVLTAHHCLAGLEVNQTGVVVGEHDISKSSDTSATSLIRAKRFIPYPYYNDDTRRYDIGLIELATPIKFTARVGPICLPFLSRNWDLTGETVKVLGWGTTEFGGPRSKVLMKVDLQLVNIQKCINSYGSDIDSYTQLCTFMENADACQYDSGGPLCFFNPGINRFEIVGLVSYGKACASQYPGVNTDVAPFLQYILDHTPGETFCYKK